MLPRTPGSTLDRRPVPRGQHPARTLVLLFLIMILIGGMLLRLPISAREEPQEWLTAYFTATSAVCVTGLAVVDTATTWSPFGQAVILLLIQVGALGYMTASTLLLLFFGREPGLHARLLLRETLGEVSLRDAGRLFLLAVRFTLVIELIGAVILAARFALEPDLPLGLAVWRGVFHSVSAFCNAGFDLFGVERYPIASLGMYQGDLVVNLTVAALIILGGLGFPVWGELYFRFTGREPDAPRAPREQPSGSPRTPPPHMRGRRPLTLYTRLVLWTTFILLLFGTVAIFLTEWTNPRTLGALSFGEKLLVAFFQSVTTRTAGFATVDFADLRAITLMIMGVLMVIGASPSGTGGGIKTTTFAVTLMAVRASLIGRPDVEVSDRRVPPETIYRALVLLVLALAILVMGTLALVFTEPAAMLEGGVRDNLFIQLQFEAMSAFATVGLSTGITPLLTEAGQLVIMALMFIGRLGPITIATAWTVPGPPPKRHFPEERVPLG